MPTQSSEVSRLYTYGVFDTGPPINYIMKDRDGTIIDLTDADSVYIDIGWQSYDHYWRPTQAIVVAGPCNILNAAGGEIEYPIQEGDLKAVGNYDFNFRIKWNDGTVQTVRSLSRDYIAVQAGPYSGFEKLP